MKNKTRGNMIDSLMGLKGNIVRYWVIGNEDAECEYGKLLDVSEHGITFGCVQEQCPNCGGLDFIPWARLSQISYFRSDGE